MHYRDVFPFGIVLLSSRREEKNTKQLPTVALMVEHANFYERIIFGREE